MTLRSIRARLERLERIAARREAESAEVVLLVMRYGYDVPAPCYEAILARHRAEHTGSPYRVLDACDDGGRCAACGQYHVKAESAGEDDGRVVKRLGNVSMSEI